MSRAEYVLYGDKGSGSAAIELALAEAGAAFSLSDVLLETDSQRGRAYANVNPQRKLPTLITPEGETLTESAAILLYLADRYPDASLLPVNGHPS
ncbi:MAG: glutathione S-transferase N-terminal domain-containing protein, partial [Henriciella sp.]|uniref:glutathione S-transferase N-terminal domain-containing protein n=1 Tax=Henriciella sp. TaxID=1968823 RepID=UPI003C788221